MLDAIAKRYSVLPSHLIAEGDTFDLMVMDVAVSYERHMQNKQSGTAQYDKDSLIQAMESVRGRNT